VNDFKKEELEDILSCVDAIRASSVISEMNHGLLQNKIQFMIDNYYEDPWISRKIAESHLKEAESLISHAICLLRMKDE